MPHGDRSKKEQDETETPKQQHGRGETKSGQQVEGEHGAGGEHGARGEEARDEKGGEQKAAKKTPALHLNSPQQDAEYSLGAGVPFDFECEGDSEFKAVLNLVAFRPKDLEHRRNHHEAHLVKLDETGKGHGHFSVDTSELGAGTYTATISGESGGESAAAQKISFSVADTKKQVDQGDMAEGGNVPEDAGKQVGAAAGAAANPVEFLN